MKKRFIPALLFAMIVLVSSSSALAAQINTLTQYLTIVGMDYESDTAASGMAASSVLLPDRPFGHANSNAAGNDSGDLAVAASIYLENTGFIFGNSAYGLASWTESYTVEEDGHYALDFSIADGRLSIMDGSDAFGTRASYAMGVYIDDVAEWTSASIVSGSRSGLQFRQSGEMLGSTYFEEDGGRVQGYEFSPYSDSLDLGFLSAGTTFDISLVSAVAINARGWGTGAAAYFGNPLDLTNPGMTGQLVTHTPVPATFLLFGLGLVSLLSLRRIQFLRL